MFVFKHLTTLRTLMESTWHLGFFLFEGRGLFKGSVKNVVKSVFSKKYSL